MKDEILEIRKDKVIDCWRNSDEKIKKLLENIFGEHTFKASYKDVKTYEDACNVLGEEPVDFYTLNELLENNGFKPLSAHEIAYKKLATIAKALNLGWSPNWADFDEYKYYPWFDLRKEDTPAGVSSADNGVALELSVLRSHPVASAARASYGGALASGCREIAIYFGKQFKEIWKDFLVGNEKP